MANYLTLLVKPTHICNMNCSYCYDKIYRDTIHTKMSLESVKRIAQTARGDLKTVNWIWHGGEILTMGIDWVREALHIVSKEMGSLVNFSLQTNGLALTEEWCDLFKQYNVSIGISFDGLHHAETRGNNTEQILAAIELAKSKDLKPGLICVLTESTMKDWKANIDYFKERHIKRVAFNIVHAKDISGSDEFLGDLEEFIKHYKDFISYIFLEQNELYDRNVEALLINMSGGGECVCERSNCTGKYICVTPELDIYPCDRYYPEQYKLGELDDFESFNEVFLTDAYARHITARLTRESYCKETCEIYDKCQHGCNATALLYNDGSFEKPDETGCIIYRQTLAHLEQLVNLLTEEKLATMHPKYVEIIRSRGLISCEK